MHLASTTVGRPDSGLRPLLEVDGVSLSFGGVVALDGIGFEVREGEIVGLIGPNGAGKTTLFNCLSRLYTPSAGDIRLRGRSLLGASRHGIARLGIGRTFQNLALFASMTVLDNVVVGGHARGRGDFLSDALGLPWARRERRRQREHAGRLLDDLQLAEVARARVRDLPFGTQKRVELARALAGRPALLLLDEPAGGLNHDEVSGLAALIRRLPGDYGATVLLVEHHMGLVMSVSDRVVAVDFGRKIGEGTPAEVRANPAVVRAYLGAG